jgi:hypothetical protein
MALGVARIILAKLSACLSVLEPTMLRRTKAVCSGGGAKVLVIALLWWVLGWWLSAIVLVWWLLAVLALRRLIGLLGRVATLLSRVGLAVAGLLLVTWVVALLAVLVVWT